MYQHGKTCFRLGARRCDAGNDDLLTKYGVDAVIRIRRGEPAAEDLGAIVAECRNGAQVRRLLAMAIVLAVCIHADSNYALIVQRMFQPTLPIQIIAEALPIDARADPDFLPEQTGK